MEENDKVIVATKDEFITIQQSSDIVYLTKEEAVKVLIKIKDILNVYK